MSDTSTAPPGGNLDLDAMRASRRAKQPDPFVTIGERQVTIPAGLPLEVLEPLTHVNMDVSVLVRQIMDAYSAGQESGEGAAETMVDVVVDMLVVNPSLPGELVTAGKAMARRLFGDDAYEHLVSCRLELPEVAAIGRWAMRHYGVGLGEALRSSGSQEGTGETSAPTSRTPTASTSKRPSRGRRTPGS